MLFLGGGVLMGIGIALTSFSIIMAAFGRLVAPEKRSWSFGIATAASSMGQFVFAPLGQLFIAAYGWQNALLLLAASTLLMVVLSVPLGASKGGVARGEKELDLSMRQALWRGFGHGSYLLLISGFFVCGQIAFMTVHLPAYLIERGISASLAAWAIGIVGLFNVVGSYLAGVYGGHASGRQGLVFIYLARSAIIAAFILFPVTALSTVLFTASMGLLWLSTVPLTMGLVTLMSARVTWRRFTASCSSAIRSGRFSASGSAVISMTAMAPMIPSGGSASRSECSRRSCIGRSASSLPRASQPLPGKMLGQDHRLAIGLFLSLLAVAIVATMIAVRASALPTRRRARCWRCSILGSMSRRCSRLVRAGGGRCGGPGYRPFGSWRAMRRLPAASNRRGRSVPVASCRSRPSSPDASPADARSRELFALRP